MINKYRPAYIDIKDIIAFISLKMKDIYDLYHKLIFFKKGDYVNLRFYRKYRIPAVKFKKIR